MALSTNQSFNMLERMERLDFRIRAARHVKLRTTQVPKSNDFSRPFCVLLLLLLLLMAPYPVETE